MNKDIKSRREYSIEDIEELISEWVPPSEKTARQYNRCGELIKSRGFQFGKDETCSKKTFYYRKAALRYWTILWLKQLVADYRMNEGDESILKRMNNILDSDYDWRNIKQPPKFNVGNTRSSSRKRNILRKLPNSWLEDMWNGMRNSTHVVAYATVSSCGCRPGELAIESGVQVSIDGNMLKFHILGGKVRDEISGQDWREITVFPNREETKFLYEVTSMNGGSINVYLDNPKKLTDVMRSVSKRLFPKVGRVTPYVFRHLFSSHVKQCGDIEMTAKAMGHRSAETQQAYAMRSQSGGYKSNNIVAVSAANKVIKVDSVLNSKQSYIGSKSNQKPSPKM